MHDGTHAEIPADQFFRKMRPDKSASACQQYFSHGSHILRRAKHPGRCMAASKQNRVWRPDRMSQNPTTVDFRWNSPLTHRQELSGDYGWRVQNLRMESIISTSH